MKPDKLSLGTSRRLLSGAAILVIAICASRDVRAQSLDRPTAEVWQPSAVWTASAEADYSTFVAAIGRAVAQNRCHTLEACLNDPTINPLHQAVERRLRFRADCADVPYTLRAYFAYRFGLPFAFAAQMRGRGHDVRYFRDARPEGLRTWTQYATPRRLLESIGYAVHSGFFRTAPEVENADFYPAALDRNGIRPGTVYYDPNGHVLVVYEITAAGDVLLFDGHPDNSMTHRRLSNRYPLGGERQGGGFKNFRPIEWRNGAIVQASNESIADFGGSSQYDSAHHVIGTRPVDYYAWVRTRLATTTPSANIASADVRAAPPAPRRVRVTGRHGDQARL